MSSLEIIAETISLNRDSVLGVKLSKDTPEKSRVESEENFQGKHFALSPADDNISN